jgi:hypothetical protein
MACVNQSRPHNVNQMGMTQSKAVEKRHGRGTAGEQHGNGRRTAWERHGMCESAFNLPEPSGPHRPLMGMLYLLFITCCGR